MNAYHYTNTENDESKLRLTIANNREKLLLMSIFGADTEAILKVVNTPKTTFVLIGEEPPFTYEEVKKVIDAIFVAI